MEHNFKNNSFSFVALFDKRRCQW